MDCLRCKEEMIKAKLKGDAVGTVVYLTNKKNGIFENEKNSTVSCYVSSKIRKIGEWKRIKTCFTWFS